MSALSVGGVLLATRLPGAGVLAAALAGALVVVAALVVLMRRHADAFALLAVFTLPFRIPIATGGRTVNLLVPLYLVVAAGAVAHLLPRLPALRGVLKRDSFERLRERSLWTTPDGVTAILLGAIVLYALQASYSADRVKALENVAFFYLPFALLFLTLREARWRDALIARCLSVMVALAVIFAGVGFIEYARKSLFLNPKVVAANQYDNFFRVNSVFFDPSIYGRFLVLVMIALMTVVLVRHRASVSTSAATAVRERRTLLGAAAVLAWLMAGLVTSFSQSSIAALLLGLAVLGAWCWGVRPTVYLSGGLVALALVFVLLAPSGLHFGLKGSSGSAANATSGRTTLVGGGLELFTQRPLEGYGSGSFETEYKRHGKTDAVNATSASHTIPVTIAAEQGIVGLAVYLALLASAFVVLFRGAARSPARIAIAACFAALVLHTWTYADFLEDPFTWALLAVGLALARPRDDGGDSGIGERAQALAPAAAPSSV